MAVGRYPLYSLVEEFADKFRVFGLLFTDWLHWLEFPFLPFDMESG